MSKSVEPAATRPSDEPSLPLRVLLVEDHSDLAEAMGDFLRGEGLEVRAALSGREALDVAAVFKPQLVLCDLNLPDMNGLDVIRGLRSNAANEPIYIAILSAVSGAELQHHREAQEQAIDAVISKPIRVDALHRLLEATRRRIAPERNNP